MEKYYEPRHVLMALGICLIVASPFLLIFVPHTIANITYHTTITWHVFVPMENYFVYGVSLLFLVIAMFIPFLLHLRKFSITISAACLLFSFIAFFLTARSYTSLSEEAISYRTMLSRKNHTYSWDEVERVIYNENGVSEYEILFHDSNQVTLPNDAYFDAIRMRLYRKLWEMNVRIEGSE
ncbi:hypothetical protein [Bacillus sp. FJAT-50079]|uniref:hypothetical protein n=1 Tax=Bacillus sp. FJAT-50079 TaxID=2833577 RepID=UPI001BC91181|nr:hypothetical protein [Bacillus sp. FJAT-50079]MBS4208447.1 hypothetical protein [Bacillus sp. FJAT-50079]